MTDEKPPPEVKPPVQKKRFTRGHLLLCVAGALLLSVGVFCLLVVLPAVRVGREARRLTSGDVELSDVPSAAIKRLGGPERAARRLRFYLWLPRRVTPYREQATMLLGACGKPGLKALLKALHDEDPNMRAGAAIGLGAPHLRAESESTVPALIPVLNDPHPKVRAYAIISLGWTGRGAAAAIPRLMQVAQGRNRNDRGAAIYALGKIDKGSPEVVALLRRELDDGPERHAALRGLRAMGLSAKPSVPALSRALDPANNPGARWIVLDILERVGPDGREAAAAVARCCADKDGHVRESAVKTLMAIEARPSIAVPALMQALRRKGLARIAAAAALGSFGPEAKAAVPALRAALKDKTDDLRAAAAASLGEIGDRAATDDLIKALRDNYYCTRSAAAEALGSLGEGRAAKALCWRLKDNVHEVRQEAARALGRLAQPDTVKPLKAALARKDESGSVRVWVAWALHKMGETDALPLLIRELRSEDSWTAHEAAKALGELRDRRAVLPLIEKLREWQLDSFPTESATRALGEIGDPRALPVLREIAKGKDYFVRQAAAEALKKIEAARKKKAAPR